MNTRILNMAMMSALALGTLTLPWGQVFAASAEQRVEALGNKILVIENFSNPAPKFLSNDLDLFCDRLATFSKKYVDEYEEYECDLITEHNQIICDMIQKGISRNSSGINAFGTELGDQVDILLVNRPKDYELLRSEVAKVQGVKPSQVVIADEFARYQLELPQVVWQSEGLFKKIIEVGKIKPNLSILNAVQSDRESALLQISERYLACAIKAGEASLFVSATSKLTIKDPIESKLLTSLWETYEELKKHWESLSPASGGVQLIRMGAKMGELEAKFRKDPKLSSDYRFKMEDWFNKFLVQVLDEEEGLNFELTDFSDVKTFEHKLYPATEYPVSLIKYFESEVDHE